MIYIISIPISKPSFTLNKGGVILKDSIPISRTLF